VFGPHKLVHGHNGNGVSARRKHKNPACFVNKKPCALAVDDHVPNSRLTSVDVRCRTLNHLGLLFGVGFAAVLVFFSASARAPTVSGDTSRTLNRGHDHLLVSAQAYRTNGGRQGAKTPKSQVLYLQPLTSQITQSSNTYLSAYVATRYEQQNGQNVIFRLTTS
jgi:hypothetical protein